MKKLFVFALALVGFVFTMNSQSISNNALGLRLGDDDALGAEISYQRKLSEDNRLEVDLGLRDGNDFDGFKLAGIYQWVWPIDDNFNWYAGVGGGVAFFDYERGDFRGEDSFIFAAGDIGIEYDFDIPLLISLDARPEIGFGDDFYDNDDLGFDIALSVRYQF